MRRVWLGIGVAMMAMMIAMSAGAQQPAAPAPGGGQNRPSQGPPLILTTTAFEDGGIIPVKYTGQDAVTPELKWTQAPAGTQSFVLLMHDPDVAMQHSTLDVTHWLVWNIPATSTGLPEGVKAAAELPDGTRQVSIRSNGYLGPGAPATGPYHHYTFELYALDIKLDIPGGAPQDCVATRTAVMKAIDGHALGKAVVFGRFRKLS